MNARLDMTPVAVFVVEHAVALLLAGIAATLGLTIVAWCLFNLLRKPLWNLAVDGWEAFRRSALFAAIRTRAPGLVRPLDRAISSPVYFGLHTAIGFLLLAPALGVLLSVADEIREDGWLTRFDIALATLLARTASTDVLAIAAVVTRLGDPQTLYAIGAMVAVVLFVRGRKLMLGGWLLATIGNGLLIRLLKLIVHRDRPAHLHGLVVEGSYSFPSGHSQGSLVVYGMLAYLIARELGERRSGSAPTVKTLMIVMIAAALVLLTGLSRIVLHVHYFSDVVAGYACGICWLALCITGLEMALRHNQRLIGNSSRA